MGPSRLVGAASLLGWVFNLDTHSQFLVGSVSVYGKIGGLNRYRTDDLMTCAKWLRYAKYCVWTRVVE